MKRLHVAVLMGGVSAERDVSLRSGAAIAKALEEAGAFVTPVDVVDAAIDLPPDTDVAFIALHGTFGEDGQVQRILERRQVPYTGSDAKASARAYDKAASKLAFVNGAVPTPTYEIVGTAHRNLGQLLRHDDSVRRNGKRLELPLVVKPTKQGSSVGVRIVRQRSELEAACHHAWQYGDSLVVERFIAGKELTVGVFDGRALPVIEIRPRQGFFSYDAKYTAGQTDYLVPAPLPSMVAAQAQHFAQRAHAVLGCRDYSRVDMILDSHNKLHVLEVNTIPGFTETSLMPKAARAAGISFKRLCERLVELALARRPEPALAEVEQ